MTVLVVEDHERPKRVEWCREIELNYRHMDFQSIALPLSYRGFVAEGLRWTSQSATADGLSYFVLAPLLHMEFSGSFYDSNSLHSFESTCPALPHIQGFKRSLLRPCSSSFKWRFSNSLCPF